jgi:membrane-bound lytic murein transglycosylase B
VRIRTGTGLEAARRKAERVARKPAFGAVVIAPLILVGAASASAPSPVAPIRHRAVTPLAAVEPSPGDPTGTSVVAATKTPIAFHIAAATISAPPPPVVVNSPGSLRIPAIALSAYRSAEQTMATADPGCGLSWNLLAGIGRIESLHANGGATDARGTAVPPIYGPALDGTLPGNEIVVQSHTADHVVYARALGPMQFLPGTWARYAGDDNADVQNVYDASLAAARYLCSGGLNLRDPSQVMAAILRYNNSIAYARNVLGWAGAYATGVTPADLPPLTGSIPLGDAHLDNYEGLGPGLPANALGLPANDPMALIPMTGHGEVASQIPTYPGQIMGPLPGPALAVAPQQQEQSELAGCAVFCITPTAPAPGLPAAPASEAPTPTERPVLEPTDSTTPASSP